jgi:hypothetical protein
MMTDVLSSANVGVAARYAAQIRELLALHESQLNARRLMESNKPPEDHAHSPVPGPRGTVVDLRA